MKKKVIGIVGIVILALVILAGVVLYTSNRKWGTELKRKGTEIFGTEYCKANHEQEIGGDAFTDWKCVLCGKEDTNPDTNVPQICADCSRITGRCMKCGKIEK